MTTQEGNDMEIVNNTEGNDIILQFMKENERRSSETLEKITSSLASSLESFSKNIADNFKKLNEKIEHCKVDNAENSAPQQTLTGKVDNADNSAPKALPAAEDNLHNTENSVATSSRDHEEKKNCRCTGERTRYSQRGGI